MGTKDVLMVQPEGPCSCIVRKAKAVNLKVYLCCVVLLSVLLVMFMTYNLGHKRNGFHLPDYALLNDSEYQLMINITEINGK